MSNQLFIKDQTLLYIHDPMCSWCWGYKATFEKLTELLPNSIHVQFVTGGLAADNNETMPEDMQTSIQNTWKRIEETIPNVKFNFNFWKICKPRRSTYSACRAVIVAASVDKEQAMIEVIQKAYYQQAKNPSDYEILYSLAEEIRIDRNKFIKQIHSDHTECILQNNIEFCRSIGAESFPALYFYESGHYHPIVLDYNNADITLEHINSYIHHA